MNEGQFSLDVLPDPSAWIDPAIRTAWSARLVEPGRPDRLQASPAWFAAFGMSRPRHRYLLACLRDQDGVPVGVAPLILADGSLVFGVGSRMNTRFRFPACHFPGNGPLLPDDEETYDRFFAAIPQALPAGEALVLSLPADGIAWQCIRKSRAIRARWLQHVASVDRSNYLDLPDSFDEYACRFSSKRRANLTRHVKRGEFRVWRATEPTEVPEFLCAAATIAAKSWQKHDSTLPAETPEWHCFLASLASHNLLRGYVLYRGEAPCAYILGYQFADEFHYWRVGYDPAHASVSPGTVLLYHAIQDLIESGGPRRIEFGIGNFEYKRHFGNAQRVMLGVLLFRRTLRNRGMIVAHRAFRLAVKTARWVLKRPPA